MNWGDFKAWMAAQGVRDEDVIDYFDFSHPDHLVTDPPGTWRNGGGGKLEVTFTGPREDRTVIVS